MRYLRSWLIRLAGVFGAGRRDADIALELETHRDLLADEYMRSGMSEREARCRASADIGSLPAAANAYRDRRGLPGLDAFRRDVAMATRSLVRTPLLSLSMILVLGLGIGISTAVVATFHTLVWRALPVPEPETVVRLAQRFEGEVNRNVHGERSGFSYPELAAYRQATRALSALAGASETRVTWQRDADVQLVRAALVTGEYFRVLSITPALGRTLTTADADRPVAVISHKLWSESFGADPAIIGRPMRLDRSFYTVVGVAPPSFWGTEVDRVGVWLPLEAVQASRGDDAALREQNMSWLLAIGRLAPGVTLDAARAEAALVGSRFALDYPGRRTTIDVAHASRLPLGAMRGERGLTPLLAVAGVLTALLGILLFICGSNAAALLLSRGAARRQEFAIRLALGAGTLHIVRQLAAEIALIAICSAGIGIVICIGALRGLARVLPLEELLLGISPDPAVFAVATSTAFGVAILFGLAPARQALRVDCLATLKGSAVLFGRDVPALRFRRALIAGQVTLSVVLLVAASLLARGVSKSWQVDTGYSMDGLFVVDRNAGSLPGSGLSGGADAAQRLADALASMPGIRAVSLSVIAPFFGTGMAGATDDAAGPYKPMHFNNVDAGFFAALDVRFVAGRTFAPNEDDAVVVNAALARLFWGNERGAIGRTLFIPRRGDSATKRAMRVVGVVPAMQTNNLGVPDEPTYYALLSAREMSDAMLLVRAAAGTSQEAIARTARSTDPAAFMSVTTLTARLAERTAPARAAIAVTGLIGLLALIVAAVGIHGVIAYAVACRTKDIGIHQALGARPRQVLALLLGWTFRGVVVGVAIALALMIVSTVAFTKPLRMALNGLNPLDPLSFLAGIGVLVVVAGIAAYLPARRALGFAPLASLRQDSSA